MYVQIELDQGYVFQIMMINLISFEIEKIKNC